MASRTFTPEGTRVYLHILLSSDDATRVYYVPSPVLLAKWKHEVCSLPQPRREFAAWVIEYLNVAADAHLAELPGESPTGFSPRDEAEKHIYGYLLSLLLRLAVFGPRRLADQALARHRNGDPALLNLYQWFEESLELSSPDQLCRYCRELSYPDA